MKILHCADLHLDMVTHSWPDPATGLPSRLVDIGRVWDWICNRAVEEEVDAVICAGDIFHVASPSSAALVLFAGGLNILRSNQIPVLLLAGNHDRAPHPFRPCVLEAFESDLVTVATRPVIARVGDLEVACLPSVSRNQLMSTAITPWVMQADEEMVDGLRRVIAGLASEKADVLTGHYSVAGAVLGGETDIAIIPEPMLQPADLEGPWSWAAFGHIHRAQPITRDPGSDRLLGAYSGAIDRMNFGEEDYTPSVTIIDLDHHVRLLDTPARRFVTLEFTEELPDMIAGNALEDAIVRIRNVPRDLVSMVRETAVTVGGAALVRIETARETAQIMRAAEVADVPGPLEALDVWLEQREVAEDLRPPIRRRASELVEASS